MIYSITSYGNPVLRKEAEFIDKNYPDLAQLIKDMFDTMYHADGVGLAAPQIGKAIRVFIIDTTPMTEDKENERTIKQAFINPEILELYGEEWIMQEGCLSLPTIHEDISRPEFVKIKYFDENFQEHIEVFGGYPARVIQHEYDHLEGKLFVDYVGSLKRRILKGKLSNIIKGKVKTNYRLSIPKL